MHQFLVHPELHLEQTFTLPTPSKHNPLPLSEVSALGETDYSLCVHVCEQLKGDP